MHPPKTDKAPHAHTVPTVRVPDSRRRRRTKGGRRRSLMSLLRRPLVIGFSPSARRRPFPKPARSIGAWFAEASAASGGEETLRLGRARRASRPHQRLGVGSAKRGGPLLLLRHPPSSGPSLCETAAKYTAGVYTLPSGTRVCWGLSSALACVAFNGPSNWRARYRRKGIDRVSLGSSMLVDVALIWSVGNFCSKRGLVCGSLRSNATGLQHTAK